MYLQTRDICKLLVSPTIFVAGVADLNLLLSDQLSAELWSLRPLTKTHRLCAPFVGSLTFIETWDGIKLKHKNSYTPFHKKGRCNNSFPLVPFSNFTTSQVQFYITIDIKYPEMCFMKDDLDCTFARGLHRSEFLWSDKWNCFLPFNERVSHLYNLDSTENIIADSAQTEYCSTSQC